MNKKIKTILAAGLLTIGMAASACTTSAWSSVTGDVVDGGAGDPTPKLSRYFGLCAIQVNGAGGYVTQNDANVFVDETSLIQRFYFHATGSGTVTLFNAFDSGSGAVFSLTYDGTNVNFVSQDGGSSTLFAVDSSVDWHSVEVFWRSNGVVDLWVDSNSLTAAGSDAQGSSGSASSIASIQLGAIGGLGGFTAVGLDEYESRRSSAIGRVVPGDTDLDGDVDSSDIQAVVDEFFGGTVGGMGNCNQDDNADLNSSDIQCQVDIFFGG